MNARELKIFLDQKVELYNQPSFIKDDPISIPHCFTKKQDKEISGFFAAVFSWGNRKTIIQKSGELMQLMDHAPHQFCLQHGVKDLKRLSRFKHRTFQSDDLYYFIEFFHRHYLMHDSLEEAFLYPGITIPKGMNRRAAQMLDHFKDRFLGFPHLKRTEKHIASPRQKSSCKRINMFLRWMVRNDDKGVDFGIWKKILPAQLICPLDLHVARVARRLGLLKRKQYDWQAAIELTEALRRFDKKDPVKYDFALFNLGIKEKF
jgi:uncharacterized protein (TIGR02757 family)